MKQIRNHKNSTLLLIFPKKGAFIFIFSIIAIFILTIVSKYVFSGVKSNNNSENLISLYSDKDTVINILNENFETGIFEAWNQTSDWEITNIEKISGNFSLKHSSKATGGNSSIFKKISADLNSFDIEWNFKLKNGNWDPSSSNRFWFYLMADTVTSSLINGWAAGVNITGASDLLQIWRIKNGKPDSLIIESDLDWNASTLATIKAKRTARGNWSLSYKLPETASFKNFSGFDQKLFGLKNIGVFFNYTTTRAGQLWVDDISINKIPAELYVQKLVVISQNKLSVYFNKPVLSSTLNKSNFEITDENNNLGQVLKLTNVEVNGSIVEIEFGKISGNKINIKISGVKDLWDKTISTVNITALYSFIPDANSLLINEVLFNPYTGGTDFVELVNTSDVSIDLSRIKLATCDENKKLKQVYALGTEKKFIKPGDFIVCTKDPKVVMNHYVTHNPNNFYTMKSYPTFPDDKGIVVLLNESDSIIDEFSYNSKMHSAFIPTDEGVSLERISINKATNNKSNWASAAASVGHATPGLPNSQQESDTSIPDEILLEPFVFSPNGDGFNDELAIKYSFDKSAYIANVKIFDLSGRPVCYLVKNQLTGQNGKWIWDGKSESGQKLNMGVYVILVDIFNQSGQTKAFKKACTITDRIE